VSTAPCETFASPALAPGGSGDHHEIVAKQVQGLELILLTEVVGGI